MESASAAPGRAGNRAGGCRSPRRDQAAILVKPDGARRDIELGGELGDGKSVAAHPGSIAKFPAA